ncbi:unnamed protein product, partial [Meganyctiphanes norvegica]
MPMAATTQVQDLKQDHWLQDQVLPQPDCDFYILVTWQHARHEISLWYVLYQWLWAIWHIFWCVASILHQGSYYGIYLTNWTYTMIAIRTLYTAVLMAYAHRNYVSTGCLPGRMGWSMKVLWILQSITNYPSLLVTATFWAALWSPGMPIGVWNIILHVCNSVYVWVDMLVSAAPVRILHFTWPLMYLLAYLIFAVVYFCTGGTNPWGGHAIYPILDFNHLSFTVPLVICLGVAAPLMQMVVWILHRRRVCLRRKVLGRRESLVPWI